MNSTEDEINLPKESQVSKNDCYNVFVDFFKITILLSTNKPTPIAIVCHIYQDAAMPEIVPNAEQLVPLQSMEMEIQRCIGLLRTNCLDYDNKKGRILYPVFSFLSHSCVNNAKHVMDPKTTEKKIR